MKRQERIAALICFLVGLLCILIANKADAKEWKLLELREVTIGYEQYLPGGHDPLLSENGLDNKAPGSQVEFEVNTDVAKYLYFNNRVHAGTDKDRDGDGRGQYRSVGWQFAFGVHVSEYLDVEYAHHSQHDLDHELPFHFPTVDSIGIKLFLYKTKTESHTILR